MHMHRCNNGLYYIVDTQFMIYVYITKDIKAVYCVQLLTLHGINITFIV